MHLCPCLPPPLVAQDGVDQPVGDAQRQQQHEERGELAGLHTCMDDTQPGTAWRRSTPPIYTVRGRRGGLGCTPAAASSHSAGRGPVPHLGRIKSNGSLWLGVTPRRARSRWLMHIVPSTTA